MLHRLVAFVSGIAGRRRLEREAAEELQFHIAQETEAHVARGMSPEEARRAALQALGGLTQTVERVRDVRALRIDAAWRDLRHAVRALRAAKGYTVVALLVLSFSIGATTAIFSVADAVLLRALPFSEADRLVAVGERNVKTGSMDQRNLVAPQNFLDWRDQQDAFTAIAAIGYARVSLRPEGGLEPETLEAQAVTSDFFQVLGTLPRLGRPFGREHEVASNARVAVISHRLWQRRFDGAADVIGRMLPGQLADFEIVGVMPPTFAYPVDGVHPDVWLPNVFPPEDRIRGDDFSYRLRVLGRLRPGVTVEQAQGRMEQITARLAAETPRWFENRVATVEPLHHYLTRAARGWTLLLLGAAACVLLLACVNLSNLMLVRGSTRGREMAVRVALGASRADIARTFLTEGLVLSLVGAALGVGIAWLGIDILRAAIPVQLPRVAEVALDRRVLSIAVLMAVATGLVASAAPLLQATGRSMSAAQTMKGRANTASASHRQLRDALVVAEVALAVVLLVGAGLFLVSYARVTHVDLGMDTRDVLTVRVRPYVGAWNWEEAKSANRSLLRRVLDEVRATPGVEMAALVSGGVPLRGDFRTIDFSRLDGEGPTGEDLDFNEISPDYFQAMRVPLIRGRHFTDHDRAGSAPVMIINAAAAARHFPGEDPIGKAVNFIGLRTVVGVVGNIRHDGPETDWRTQGFIPLEQSEAVGATLIARLSGRTADVLPAIKQAIWAEFPGVPLPDIRSLEDYFNEMLAYRRFNMLLLGLFGVLGIGIALAGIYGVMACVVVQRTREIGIRLALGALPAAIQRAVLGRAAAYLSLGLLIGLSTAWSLRDLVGSFLFDVQPADLRVYGVVATLIAATGLAAALVPARRAARVDPLTAVREE